jgi:hypothetical protein
VLYSAANMTGFGIAAFAFLLLVLVPFGVAMAVRLTRRDSPPALPPQQSSDASERLERLERAVDTIAIEMERVSEGQRILTKILSERSSAP